MSKKLTILNKYKQPSDTSIFATMNCLWRSLIKELILRNLY